MKVRLKSKKKMKKPALNPERRKFLKEATRTAGGLAGVGILLGLQQNQSLAREGVPLDRKSVV